MDTPAQRLTVGRALALVAALCLAAVGIALAVTRSVEQAHPGITRLPPIEALSVARIDVHQEVEPAELEAALQIAARSGIAAIVNLAGGSEGGRLEAQLDAAKRYGGRVLVLMNLDQQGCCGDAWIDREAARLARGQALGARGLAILRGAAGAVVASDAAEPLWAACAALRLPVALGAVGTPEERARLIERHRQVEFIDAAGWDEPPSAPSALVRALDRLPNLWLDTAGRASALGRMPAAARQALLAHPQRVLFGTGVRYVEHPKWSGMVLGDGMPVLLASALLGSTDRHIFFESTLRVFETRDSGIPSPSPDHHGEELTGLGLPRDVLQRIYHGNAERLLGVSTPEPVEVDE